MCFSPYNSGMTESEPLLEASRLHYSYREGSTRRNVLNDASLTIRKGERVALLGESGSGKSTLLNLLGAIETPERGEIQLKGILLSRLAEPDLTLFRRQHIGFIYQLFNLIPTLTVFENIALPLQLSHLPSDEVDQHVANMLEEVGLEARDRAFPDQLSGGEQQRVAIARALVHQPSLVLADEPTGNLDARTGQRILDLLDRLSKAHQQTVLMVTHSKTVAAMADRILLLENGRLLEGTDSSAW